MRQPLDQEFAPDVYAPAEIAQAAGVPIDRVREAVAARYGGGFRGFVAERDAVALVKLLRAGGAAAHADRPPVTLPPPPARRGPFGLMASGAAHAGMIAALMLAASLGLLSADDTEELIKDPTPLRLVFMVSPGPGGGGGGGGLRMPAPPPPAERKAAVKLIKRVSVPPVRRIASPPRPVPRRPPPRVEPPPRIVPSRVETPPRPIPPPPPQAVQAPVVSTAADANDKTGLPTERSAATAESNGPGTGGGVGSGAGVGLGEGQGGGIGPGSGGGTGGGPFRGGSGIEPPRLLREVRAAYTDEARRRGIEGDVALEIVVRADGSVGDVRVVRSLGGGLDQKAIAAVRQWRFSPARRQNVPVDVVVDVAVGFKLR